MEGWTLTKGMENIGSNFQIDRVMRKETSDQ